MTTKIILFLLMTISRPGLHLHAGGPIPLLRRLRPFGADFSAPPILPQASRRRSSSHS